VLPLLRHPLTLLLVAFICNTLLWAAVTNIGHPPDEFSHFDYVCHLATNHALPIYGKTLNIHTPGLQTHASLPPLYYLLGTPFQMALSNRTITEQMLALRALSVLLGAITITLAYMFGRTLSPTRPPFAFAVATLVGFNPMFTYFCAAINSDNLINLIYAALLLLLAYGLRQQQPSRRWLIGLGALLGAGLITKQTIAMGVFVSALVIVYLAWKQRTRFLLTVTRYAFWTSSTALLISGWYFVRNWFLYGSPSGMFTGPRLDSYSAHPYQAAGSLWQMIFATRSEFAARSELTQFLPTVLRSFWGIFDHLEILMPQRLYNVMTWMLMGGLLGAAFWVARAYRHRHDSLTRYRLLVAGVGGLILILTFTGLLSLSYFIDYQPQGRYLFAALTPVSVAIVAGWEQLAKLLRARWLVAPLIVVLVLIVNVLALVCALAPAQHDRYLGQMMSYKSNASVRTVYDTSPAQASFVAQHSEIKRLEMLINSPPGVQGPLICRLGQQGTTDDLLAAVVQQPLAGPACYGIDVSSCRFTAGGTYTLKLEAPNITAQQPVLAALPTDDASGDQSAADLKLKIVYPGIFSRQTLSRADYLPRKSPTASLPARRTVLVGVGRSYSGTLDCHALASGHRYFSVRPDASCNSADPAAW